MKEFKLILLFYILSLFNIKSQVYQVPLEGELVWKQIKVTKTVKAELTGGTYCETKFNIKDINQLKSTSAWGVSQSAQPNTPMSITSPLTFLHIQRQDKGSFGYDFFEFTVNRGFNQPVELKIEYTVNESDLDLNTPFMVELDDVYPIPAQSISGMGDYLGKSPGIESDNAEIVRIAMQETKNCHLVYYAVENITKWVNLNIKKGPDTGHTAAYMMSHKEGDCDGFANLLAALYRAAGIPARICSGFMIDDKFTIDLNKTDFVNKTKTHGNVNIGTHQVLNEGHAWCEVYFPQRGWVRIDMAQSTLFFGWSKSLLQYQGSSEEVKTQSSASSKVLAGDVTPQWSLKTIIEVQVTDVTNSSNSIAASGKQEQFSTINKSDNLLWIAKRLYDTPTCIGCNPPTGAPSPPVLDNVTTTTINNSTYVQLEWTPSGSEDYFIIYRCKGNETMTDDHKIASTADYTSFYEEIADGMSGEYKYAVAGVNEIGEGLNSNIKNVNITCADRMISNKTYTKNSLEEGCNIEFMNDNVSNSGFLYVIGDNVTISSDFTVETGAGFVIE